LLRQDALRDWGPSEYTVVSQVKGASVVAAGH